MANNIELSSKAQCFGLCASKQGLFITTTTKTCYETVINVIPIAAVDDVTLENPTCLGKCLGCCCGAVTYINRKADAGEAPNPCGALIACLTCKKPKAKINVNYGRTRSVLIQDVEDPENVFVELKKRLHVAKGGPTRAKM